MQSSNPLPEGAPPSSSSSELSMALLRLIRERIAELAELSATVDTRDGGSSPRVTGAPRNTRNLAALLQLQSIISDASDDLESWWREGSRRSEFDFRLPLDLAVRITTFLGTQSQAALPSPIYAQARDLAISLLFLLSVALARSGERILRERSSELRSMVSEAEASLALHDLLATPMPPGESTPKAAA